jgi:hypothetical protein
MFSLSFVVKLDFPSKGFPFSSSNDLVAGMLYSLLNFVLLQNRLKFDIISTFLFLKLKMPGCSALSELPRIILVF